MKRLIHHKISIHAGRILVLLFLGSTFALAQPSVTLLTPSAGSVGSTVVITGTGFGTAAANNIVHFGAVRGSITLATATSISVTVPAGSTPGPITVLNTTTGRQAISLTSFQVTFSGGAVNQCAYSNDLTDFVPTGGSFSATNHIVADLNNDGKPEILFMSIFYNYICLVKNNSVPGSLTSASFGDTTRLTIGPGSEQALSIATGDLDGDGLLDVLVGEGGSSPGIGIFRNTFAGSAISFAPKVQVAGLGGNIVVADLDFDGRPEVISGSNVYRNTSTPGSISFVQVTLSNLNGAGVVAVSDLDGDHKPDVTYLNGGYLYVSRNLGTVAPITSAFFGTGVSIGAYPLVSIAVSDLDGDNKPEILTMNNYSGQDTIYVYRNVATSGTLNTSSFAPRISLALGYDPTGTSGISTYVTTGDVDGDGKPDVIALDRTSVPNPQAYAIGVFANKTTPGVITPASFGREFFETGNNNGNMVVPADMDGDGRLDLLVGRQNGASYIMSVLRNTMTESGCSLTVGATAPVISSFAPATGDAGTSVVITGTNFNSTTSNMAVYFGGIKATVTAGSSTLLTVTVPTGICRERLIVLDLQTHLQAMSTSHFSETFGTTHTLDANSFNANQQFLIATTDLSGAEINYTGLADYDHDGKYDIIHQYDFFSNLHISRNLSTPTTFSFPADGLMRKSSFYGYAIPSSDLDGDGKTDMIASSYYALNIWKNKYAGGLLDSTSFSEYQNRMGGGLNDLVYPGVPADMDGDGRPDLVLTSAKGSSDGAGTFSILRNISSNGSLTFTSKIIFPQTSGTQVGLGDLNGDNKFDFVVPDGTSSNTILVYQNNSTVGNISPATFTKTTVPLGGPTYLYYSVDVVDIDGDGKQDIVLGHNHGATIVRNIYSGGPMTAASFAAPFEIANASLNNDPTLKIADLDGDGKPDIITSYIDRFYLYKNTATAGTINASSFAAPLLVYTNAVKIEVADINGDGRPELLGFAGGSVLIHYPAAAIPPNQPPVLSTTTTTDAYAGAPVLVDNQIAVSDANDANLTGATMTIDNVLPEDVLLFTNQNGIAGAYNAGSGTMTFTGSATVANYQTALRSIQYNNTAGTPTQTTRSVEIFVTDGKDPSNTINYSITFGGPPNQPPVLSTTTTGHLYSGTPLTIDAQISVTDANDANLAGAIVTIDNVLPEDVLTFNTQNGIVGSYDDDEGTMTLTGTTSVANYQVALRSLHYQNTSTTPTKTTRTIEIFVSDGKAPSNTVTYAITFPTTAPPGNKPPVITTSVVSATVKGTAIINLIPDISDPDGNLELNTLTIISQPESGAIATITAGDSLIVDYSAIDFVGMDQLTIQVCDSSAACTQQVIQIDVIDDLIIYNGISANGDQFNSYFRIENIEVLKDTQDNHVSIYNRWGDVVFEVDRYDNASRAFKGTNKNGGELPAGTYFYKIDFAGGRASLTGYLSLKR